MIKRCNVCSCHVYEDERGKLCQDCRGVIDNIAGLHTHWPEHIPDRERRIAEHAARVEREMTQ